MRIRTIASTFLRLYWRIFKPRTYGVKGLVWHPDESGRVLLVRHAYGATHEWNLPGGGYRPRRELAEQALRRELKEELALECDDVAVLGEHRTNYEGKQDAVSIFLCRPRTSDINPNREILEFAWVPLAELAGNKQYYRVVRRAAELYLSSNA